jgi:disulfide bond formation protein DsbB
LLALTYRLFFFFKGIFVNYLNELTTAPKAWLCLAFTAFGLEAVALYFQYALDLAPCIMCVYQRLAILALAFAGILGAISAKYIVGRVISFALWATASIWGLIIAIEHVDMQANSGSLFYSCEFIPNFPSWAPLHQWFPLLFEATGDCGEISWQLLGFSMPQWMVAIFGLYTATFMVVIINRLLLAKKL